jgi:hypothetical protein
VHSRVVRACARFPSPCPLPQAGEGKAARQCMTVNDVGKQRS